ncbi:MAG: hypothetical protein ACLRZH_00220 [Ruthenibacterium lactatiformans]
MGVHDDHRRRVYERFLREGLAGFEEHNAMEFLLFLARPGAIRIRWRMR